MAKRIEAGEEVIGTKVGSLPYGKRQVLGILIRKPTEQYELFWVRDKKGYIYGCYKIRRLKRG